MAMPEPDRLPTSGGPWIAVLHYDGPADAAVHDALESLSEQVRQAGATGLVVLSDGAALTSLGDAELAALGLARIRDTPSTEVPEMPHGAPQPE